MMADTGLITFLPARADDAVAWWRVEGGVIVSRGTAQPNDAESAFPEFSGQWVMALAPSAHCVVRWISMGDLAPRQAEVAARLKVESESIAASGLLHVATTYQNDQDVLTASISASLLQAGLDILARHGLDPDVILPSGLVLSETEAGIIKADIGGGDIVLRGPKLVLPDEGPLREILAGGQDILEIDAIAMEAHLLDAFAAPPINLRSGAFAKKNSRTGISPRQWRLLAWMLSGGVLLSLLLGLATYWKYDRAVLREDARALAAVRTVTPQASDPETAMAELNKALTQKGMPAQQFTALASALFAEMEASEGLTLRDLRYSGDGILAATVAAPTTMPINQMLLKLQQQGYKVTATPRQDASGLAMADISMRMP